MKRKTSGQEAMEFALIGGLVFCVAIGTTVIFGNKIASFFQSDSAVAKVANSTPNLLSSNSESNFSADYDTFAENPVIPDDYLNGSSTSVSAGDISNISATIKTSGASGASDVITDELAKEAAKIVALTEQSSDPEMLKLAQTAKEIAEIGYLVADAQEWYEKGVEKYSTTDTITIPEDNQLCEDGRLKADLGSNCDTTLVSENYLQAQNVKESFSNTLNKYKTLLINKANELKNSNTSDNAQINQAIASIDMYVNEIDEISNNLVTSIYSILDDHKTIYLKDVLNQVASKTTDLDSSLIQQTGKNLVSTDQSTTESAE